ncbi:isoflavone 2'-hydroxylase-like protein [Tanacetum coccineum]
MVEANFSNLIIFTLLIILLIKLFTNKKRWSNLPPSPPSFPIIGHLPLLKQPLHETLHHLSHKFGPVMLLRFGVKKALVVSSPSLVEECFTKTNDIIFANRPYVPSDKHMNHNFTSMGAAPYGHLWRSLRRVTASELLSTTRLISTTYAREHEVKLMCTHIYKVSSQKVELKSMFRDLLNNITTMSMIGKRYHGDVIDSGDVQSAPRFRDIMEEALKIIHTPYIGDFLPFFAWIDFGRCYEKKMIALMKRFDVFFDEVIENRRRTGNSESGIMVDKLLALQEQEPQLYTDQIIRGLILVNFLNLPKLYFVKKIYG